MLVDIKYHTVTIIALFITLGIGILIGSTIIGSDTIIEQQQSLINNLEDDFKSLRKQNQKFKAKVSNLEGRLAANLQFEKEILPLIIKNRLSGEKLLISCGDNIKHQLEDKIINFLELANPDLITSFENNQIKVNKYTKVLLIGPQDNNLKEKYVNSDTEIIEVDTNNLESIPQIIEFVLQITTKDLVIKKGGIKK